MSYSSLIRFNRFNGYKKLYLSRQLRFDCQAMKTWAFCFFLLQGVTCKKWMLVGGLLGGDDATDAVPTNQVELLELQNEGQSDNPGQWCSLNLTSMNMALDGATINFIPTFNFVDYHQANNPGSVAFPYLDLLWEKALLCGGSNPVSQIQENCRSQTGTIKVVFKSQWGRFLLHFTYYSPSGYLWILGGRAGSEILQDTEILRIPHARTPGLDYSKGWDWINNRAKDIAKWDAIPAAQQYLPMPLAGHCVLDVKLGTDRFAMVLGGVTSEKNSDGEYKPKSGPVISSHVHLYDFQLNQWFSSLYESNPTYVSSRPANRELKPLRIPRQNHACVSYIEGGAVKVMVAGGLTINGQRQSLPLDSVESLTLDIAGESWFQEAKLPNIIIGGKMTVVNNRPALLGRFGFENTNIMLRYTLQQTWEIIPTKLKVGRSDFKILELPVRAAVYPVNGRVSSGPDATYNLNKVKRGSEFTTGKQIHPWVELDLGAEINIAGVKFESGSSATAQAVEIRVGSSPIPGGETVDTLISVNNKCSGAPDGVTAPVYSACNKKGRYVTVQLIATTPDTLLEVGRIRVYGSTPSCF
ncbi:uncharacterized protein LOC111705045 [Eurytemora carolleeae]|uniref:uncharacterized protein LOC111705045 n=1 Tax=Eurytemora carolleeae TaxID=1294199 RepID=UPI000C75B2A9|nr:uncharacterized protein LOC111705045 [Eurytemora carolleeae]|eukprot:XP_023333241.1 uncharacterized protein LOC111705045 [Eurytemora affinis]